MAHNYIISSVLRTDDTVTIKGTVDGTAVTFTVWLSAILPMTQAQRRAYLAAEALKAFTILQGPTDLTASFGDTFTL